MSEALAAETETGGMTMKTYVWLTFAFLGWGYYEASGGADFKPGPARAEAEVAEVMPAAPQPAALQSPERRRPALAADATVPRGSLKVRQRVESALLVALRNAPQTRDGAPEAGVHRVAFAEDAAAQPFAPARPVVIDTSTPETGLPEGDPAETATATAPIQSPRPKMRPGTQLADSGTPRLSTRGDPVSADHAVAVSRANLRVGPGTNFPVLDRLARGDRVRVLRQGPDGWVKLRSVELGRIGWMAGSLIAED